MRLKDEEIGKYEDLEIEILDEYHQHPDIEVFKNKSCEAFGDTVKFFLT